MGQESIGNKRAFFFSSAVRKQFQLFLSSIDAADPPSGLPGEGFPQNP